MTMIRRACRRCIPPTSIGTSSSSYTVRRPAHNHTNRVRTTLSQRSVSSIQIRPFLMSSISRQTWRTTNTKNLLQQHCHQIYHWRYQHTTTNNNNNNNTNTNKTVVYAIGEGWTGALGTGRIDQMIIGHGDEDFYTSSASSSTSSSSSNTTNGNKQSSWWTSFATNHSSTPVVVYDTSSSSSSSSSLDVATGSTTTKQRLVSCAVGWGHTALIVEEEEEERINAPKLNHSPDSLDHRTNDGSATTTTTSTTRTSTSSSNTKNTQLLLMGRPHEFASLLRLQRLPRTIRNWLTYLTYNTVRRANVMDRHSISSTEKNSTNSENEPNNNNTGSHPVVSMVGVSLNPIDMIGQALSFLSKLFGNPNTDPDWDAARDQSYLIVPTAIPLPFDTTTTTTSQSSPAISQQNTISDPTMLPTDIDPRLPVSNDVPVHVTCTAGITAITTTQGYVYTFGLNGIGQCGTGDTGNNVWIPSRVTGLSRQFCAVGYRAMTLPQSYPIQQTCLGLQHGLCVNVIGEMFSWGKGDRGQLGNDTIDNESHTAVPITKAAIMNDDYTSILSYHALQPISQISTGMIHSAAYEPDTNSVYVWGKHTLPFVPDEAIEATVPRSNNRTTVKRIMERDKIASDARIPVRVNGLPTNTNQAVVQIACGSHHTSMLLDDGSVWCIGITTDTKRPQHTPICIVAAGMIDLALVTQFTAHMDRTTIVFDGQVVQVHLWDDPEYQKDAAFTPAWVDELLASHPTARIREVHRSWLHTVIVADHCQ